MDFKKDILLIDTEFSGFDLEKHEILQIAAVLLDKKTLKEKKHFDSFVHPTPSRWKARDKASMEVNRITMGQLKGAPTLKSVIKKFDRVFGHNVIQAFYVGFNDKRFLMESYRRAGIRWRFDYHYFEIWALFYGFLAKKNLLKSNKDFAGFGLEYLMDYFKLEVPTTLHDALTDCRVEAEILRRIIKEV